MAVSLKQGALHQELQGEVLGLVLLKKGGGEEESRCGVQGEGCVGQYLLGLCLPFMGFFGERGLLKR